MVCNVKEVFKFNNLFLDLSFFMTLYTTQEIMTKLLHKSFITFDYSFAL